MCFVWVSEQTRTYALCSINELVFISGVQSVYCAVLTEYLHKTDTFHLERVNDVTFLKCKMIQYKSHY